MSSNWREAQNWESSWWGSCNNTFNEEQKQYIYAEHMGLTKEYGTNWYGRKGWDFGYKVIADVGGGPCSILLKSIHRGAYLIEPLLFPEWVEQRYKYLCVNHIADKAEDPDSWPKVTMDETIIYNCLQHSEDWRKILSNALANSKIIRIFEFVNTPVNIGHIHSLDPRELNEILRGEGKTINSSGVVSGECYFGIFKGDQYENR